MNYKILKVGTMNLDRRKFINVVPFGLLSACVNAPPANHEIRILEPSKELIYENSLAKEELVKNFHLEGKAFVTFPYNRMRLQNAQDSNLGQASNFVFWCNEKLPKDVEIVWEFLPVKEPGLCVAFFNANGQNGKDLFDPGLKFRSGQYDQYTNSDINTLQISYFRRRWPEERAFHLCNLRKAPGFELLATAADPIPDVEDVKAPFLIKIRRHKKVISFSINDLPLFAHVLENEGALSNSGYFGFRQMAPLIGEYANLKVYVLK